MIGERKKLLETVRYSRIWISHRAQRKSRNVLNKDNKAREKDWKQWLCTYLLLQWKTKKQLWSNFFLNYLYMLAGDFELIFTKSVLQYRTGKLWSVHPGGPPTWAAFPLLVMVSVLLLIAAQMRWLGMRRLHGLEVWVLCHHLLPAHHRSLGVSMSAQVMVDTTHHCHTFKPNVHWL